MSSVLETTLVRRRKRARKWQILLLFLFNGEGEMLTGRQLCSRNQAMVTGPVVGNELFALETDAVE